jgi:hypothetical protein
MPFLAHHRQAVGSIIVLLELGCAADRAFVLVLLQRATAHDALRHAISPLDIDTAD